MVKISVILPVYNEEKYLMQCLDSICGQTLREIEIICVDDGSTDSTPEILQEYAENDNRIIVLSQQNQYAGVARNNGMKIAKGKYLSFLDSDDYFEPRMLEKLYGKAEEHNLDIAICRHKEYNEILQQINLVTFEHQDSFIQDKELFSGTDLKYCGVFNISSGWAWDKLFRADFVRKCGCQFPDMRSSEDGVFVYLLMAQAKRMTLLDERLVIHRVGNSNSLSRTHGLSWINGFRMWLMIQEGLMSLKIYDCYEQSFLNAVEEYMFWYPDSVDTGTTYKKSVKYLQEEFEPKVGILKKGNAYFWRQLFHEKYLRYFSDSIEEQIFCKMKLLERQLEEQQKAQQYMLQQQSEWVFPFGKVPKGSTVILYGAGRIGKLYAKQLAVCDYCRKVIWADNNYKVLQEQGVQVVSPEQIVTETYDYVVVANKNQQKEITEDLLSLGVSEEKIIFFS